MRRIRVFRGATLLLGMVALACACATSSGLKAPGTADDGGWTVPALPPPPDPVPTPLPDDLMGATVHRLENGLTVYISTDRAKPRFSAWIAVKAGSRHDPAHSTGLAHYLEHMLFKGTTQLGTLDAKAEAVHLERIEALYAKLFGEQDGNARQALLAEIDKENQATTPYAIPNEFERLYASLGVAGLNAFTSDDRTVYIADVPSNRLEQWARVEAARMRDPVFRLFLPELEAVYEEKNQSMDSPERRAGEAMSLLLYPKHPYGTQPTIGIAEHLKSPAFKDMVAYFRRWYVPNNMAIVLAGDVDAETALPVVRRYFGDWEAKPLSPPQPAELPRLNGRVYDEIQAEGEEVVQIAWQTVPHGHPHELALELADMILDNRTSGLINAELVLAQKVAAAGSFPQAGREAGSQWLWATAKEGQPLGEVEALLHGMIAKLKAGAFTQAELDAILLDYEIGYKRSLESNGSRVSAMTTSFTMGEPWAETVARRKRRAQVTKAQVVAAANRYLGGDFAVVYRKKGKFEPPRIAKPTITPFQADPSRKSGFAAELEGMPAEPVPAQVLKGGEDYVRGQLPAGALIAVENERNDLFTVQYRIETGMRRQALLCHAIDLQEKSGAGDLDATALQRRLFALGASIGASCSVDEVWVTASGIDANMEETLALLDQWFRKPVFDDADVSKLLAVTLTNRRNTVEDPRSADNALISYMSQGKNSRFLLSPSNQALRVASGAKLSALLAALPDFQHKTFYYGPRDAADAARAIGFGRNHKPLPPRPVRRYRRVERDTLLHLPRDKAQASITLIFPGPPMARTGWALSELVSAYLGGANSLIFQDIRESRGLAYSAGGWHMLGDRPIDETGLAAQLATQPDKTGDAIARLLELLRQIPVDPNRLDQAKAIVDEQIRTGWIHPRDIPGAVHSWEEFGEKTDPREALRAEVAALTTEAFQKKLRAMVRVPFTIALTGKGPGLDVPALGRRAKIAAIELMETERLFSYGPFGDRGAPEVSSAPTP